MSDRLILDSALLAVAREHGFASWARLKNEVDRREILDTRDLAALTVLLAAHPELAVEPMLHWCDHPQEATPLGYVATLRYDTSRGSWRDVPGTGAVARKLLEGGAPPDGADGSTALHEAAYSGQADSVRHLLARGADPARRDRRFDATPLGWCCHRREETGPGQGHDDVELILGPITPHGPRPCPP